MYSKELRNSLLIALLACAPAGAAEPTPSEGPAPAARETLDRSTPRGAVLGFLTAAREGHFAEAASYLDLAPVPEPRRAERGPELARQLKTVLDRTLWIDLQTLSAEPEGDAQDGLPPGRDLVGRIDSEGRRLDVTVDRVRRGAGEVWEISAATVAAVPALYERFGYGPLAEWLPDVLLERQVLELRLWQWLALLVLAPLALAASWLVVRVALSVVRPLVARSSSELDDRLLEVLGGPLRLGLALPLFFLALRPLGLSIPALAFFRGLLQALAVLAATWLLTRGVDILGSALEERLARRGQSAAISLVPLGRKTLKVAIVALALLAALDTFGFDVTALIAGLGVGGLAVALAAQKTIENLFGGATLLADRPVRVGEFCRFGDKVGTIEAIGMRSTRVRTLDRTLVTVPNAEFSALQLENFAARDRLWYHPTLGLRYETSADQLRWVLGEIRRMLLEHEQVDDDPVRVRFVRFGDFSLDIEVFAYVKVTDYSEFLAVAEDLNLRIMGIVEESGTGFAFPSHTSYLAHDDGLDPERTRAAEAAVAGWRKDGRAEARDPAA